MAAQYPISGDPTRAWTQVSLYNAENSSDKLHALCNPESLELSLSVASGELSPVGWSHPVLMYGSTGAWQIPLKLYFSQFILRRRGYMHDDISKAVTWLTRFAYPKERGLAPSRLVLVWPNVLAMPCVLLGIRISHTKFNKFLKATITEVELQLKSYRRYFMSAPMIKEHGFNWSDDEPASDHTSPMEPSGSTGLPTRLGTSSKVDR